MSVVSSIGRRGWIGTLSAHQRVLRLGVLLMPLVAMATASAAASQWSIPLMLLAVALSLACVAQPDSNLGLAVIVLIAWHWAHTVGNVLTPWVLPAAAALMLFHVSMAAATVSPPAARWTASMVARWRRRSLTVMSTIAVSYGLARAFGGLHPAGNALLLACALALLASVALFLRARGLGRR